MCQEKGLSGDVSLGMLSAQVVLKAMMWGIIPQAMNRDREESGPGPALDAPTLRVNLRPRLTWSSPALQGLRPHVVPRPRQRCCATF